MEIMKQLLVVLGITLWTDGIASIPLSPCENHSNCSCIYQTSSYEVSCPKSYTMDSVFTAEYVPRKRFQIQCKNTEGVVDFNLINGLKIGLVESLEFKFCPLPNLTFVELMEAMKMNTGKISFNSHSKLGNQLSSSFFRGLENITQLDLNNNGLTMLPIDLFKIMPKLTNINLRENALKSLPKNIFIKSAQIDILELGSNELIFLEPGVFKNLINIRLLNLWGNNLVNLTRALFSDVPQLLSLDLSSNGLRTLPPDIFADLNKLSELNLGNNRFTYLPSGLFLGTRSLKKLRLINNRETLNNLPSRFLANLTMLSEIIITGSNILTLPEDLLWDSPNIINISFQGNKLKSLPQDLLKDAKELQTINFSDNQLETLPDLLFESNLKLENLLLEQNNLLKLSSQTIGGLSNLILLNLKKNKLNYIDPKVFSGLKSLKEIDLSYNNLTFMSSPDNSSPFQNCKDLENVFLAHNKIQTIFYTWRILRQLRYLDLSHNNINKIEREDLNFLSSELTVDVRNNNITSINLRNIEVIVLDQINSNKHIDYNDHQKRFNFKLGNNPIECDCFLYDLIRYYEKTLKQEVLSLYRIEVGDTRCAGPAELRQVEVSKVNSKMLQCTWDQVEKPSHPCPKNCSCYFRVNDLANIIDCSNLNLTHIPGSLPSVKDSRITELIMNNNKLKKLPTNELFDSQNITKIDVSFNQITDISDVQFPSSLQVLKLDHNNLTALSTNTLDFLGQMDNLTILTLHGNNWQCNCQTQTLVDFIQKYFIKIPNRDNITCWPNGVPLKNLSVSDLCSTTELIIIFSIFVAVLGLLTGILAALYFYYQQEIKIWLYANKLCLWFVTEDELDKDKRYDAFVSYSILDRDFVEKILVPELEKGPQPFKLCLHFRDWKPGDWIHNQIIRSVEESRRTLIVLSKNFLESNWSKLEFQAAHKQALNEGRARIIIIIYGDIGHRDNLDPDLKSYLSMNTYVEWGDPWFWKKLKYALPHPPEICKKIPGELRDRNLKRFELTEKVDLVQKLDISLNMETTPPGNSVTTNLLKSVSDGTTEYNSKQNNTKTYKT